MSGPKVSPLGNEPHQIPIITLLIETGAKLRPPSQVNALPNPLLCSEDKHEQQLGCTALHKDLIVANSQME